MPDHIGSSRIIKIGIVTEDVEKTTAAFRAIFSEGPVPESQWPASADPDVHVPYTVTRSKEYKGQQNPNTPMRVMNFYTDNFWFEIVQPLPGDPNPWSDHLAKHGTSVCFMSVHIPDGLDHDIKLMGELGFPMTFIEDKGYERYTYYDTADTLGLLLEIKERVAR